MKVLVGTFNEQDLKEGKDKAAIQEAKAKHGLKYSDTKLVKKGEKIVGIKVWVCDADDVSFEMNL